MKFFLLSAFLLVAHASGAVPASKAQPTAPMINIGDNRESVLKTLTQSAAHLDSIGNIETGLARYYKAQEVAMVEGLRADVLVRVSDDNMVTFVSLDVKQHMTITDFRKYFRTAQFGQYAGEETKAGNTTLTWKGPGQVTTALYQKNSQRVVLTTEPRH